MIRVESAFHRPRHMSQDQLVAMHPGADGVRYGDLGHIRVVPKLIAPLDVGDVHLSYGQFPVAASRASMMAIEMVV